jgi:NAD(P)H-dependent FMN reductase
MQSNILVIASTVRKQSNSKVMAEIFSNMLQEAGAQSGTLFLEDLPTDFLSHVLHGTKTSKASFENIQNLVNKADKIVFIVPEYNGSFPGVLKTFIDALEYPSSLKHKKAAMVGISAGTQGGALAMGHLADILNYCGMYLLPFRPRLIQVDKYILNSELHNQEYVDILRLHAKAFVEF